LFQIGRRIFGGQRVGVPFEIDAYKRHDFVVRAGLIDLDARVKTFISAAIKITGVYN
jgi:hypothetical protein